MQTLMSKKVIKHKTHKLTKIYGKLEKLCCHENQLTDTTQVFLKITVAEFGSPNVGFQTSSGKKKLDVGYK